MELITQLLIFDPTTRAGSVICYAENNNINLLPTRGTKEKSHKRPAEDGLTLQVFPLASLKVCF